MNGAEAKARVRNFASMVAALVEVSDAELVEMFRSYMGMGRSASALRSKRYRDTHRTRDERDGRHASSVTNDTHKRDERHGASVTNDTDDTPEVSPGSERSEGGPESEKEPEESRNAAVPEGEQLAMSTLVSVRANGASVTNDTPATRKTKRDRKSVTRWRRVPADWVVKDSHRNLAYGLIVDVEFEAASFRDHEFQRPLSDADAAFRNWIREAARRRNPRFGSGPRTTQAVQPSHGANGFAKATVVR